LYRIIYLVAISVEFCGLELCRRSLYSIVYKIECIAGHINLFSVGRVTAINLNIKSINFFFFSVVKPGVFVTLVSVIIDYIAGMDTCCFGVIPYVTIVAVVHLDTVIFAGRWLFLM
jgi:hypothetical protein